MATRLSTREEYATLVDAHDTFLFDCDGVLWNGDSIVDGVTEVLSMLRSKKKSVLFVTNNATKSREDYKKKFDKMGVQASVEEIFGSAYASAVYISTVLRLPPTAKVFVIGMAGLEHELDCEGISHIGGSSAEDNVLTAFDLATFRRDPDVKAVLCGLDTAINYTKLSKAFQYLHEREDEECRFLATNVDSTYPANGGMLPGAGALSAVLSKSLGREPLSIGKPGRTMMDCIKAKHDFDPKRTIMIGDRLDTDIMFGKNGGVSTLLVMTGALSVSLTKRLSHTRHERPPNPIPNASVCSDPIDTSYALPCWPNDPLGVTTERTLSNAATSSLPDYIVPSLGNLPGCSGSKVRTNLVGAFARIGSMVVAPCLCAESAGIVVFCSLALDTWCGAVDDDRS